MRKFGWDEERTAQAIRVIENAATVIEPPQLAKVIEGGHADNRVLECAVAASADYLITGDRRHLLPIGEHQGTRIVNAPRFLSAGAGRIPGRFGDRETGKKLRCSGVFALRRSDV